jgi:Ca-activated chloride channel homolog
VFSLPWIGQLVLPMLMKLLLLVLSVTSTLVLERAAASSLQESATDLALVLAVDASSSIDDDELAIQLRGIANAFRHTATIEAIKAGPTGRIDVVLLLWSGGIEQTDRSEWARITCESDALAFADRIETFPRRVRGSTSVGSAIMASVALLRERAQGAGRLAIDISGDGEDNLANDRVEHMLSEFSRDESVTRPRPTLPKVARSIAAKLDITINALVLQTDERDLATWYSRNVITEDGFVMTADTPYDFVKAFHRKLLREIRQPNLSLAGPNRTDHAELLKVQ